MLAVVHHEQQLSARQRCEEPLDQRLARRLADPDDPRDLRGPAAESRIVATSTKAAPSANPSAAAPAAARASRVLPTPGGPVSVRSRISGVASARSSAASSASRSIRGVGD